MYKASTVLHALTTFFFSCGNLSEQVPFSKLSYFKLYSHIASPTSKGLVLRNKNSAKFRTTSVLFQCMFQDILGENIQAS